MTFRTSPILLRPVLALWLMAPTSFCMAQNSCGNALSVGLGTHAVPGITGPEVALPNCTTTDQASTSASMWYRFTASTTTGISLSTAASGIDTRVHIYTGPCDALICHAGDDDGGPGETSLANFNVVPGTTYTIAFDDRWSASGFNFTLSEIPLLVGITFTNAPLPQVSGQFVGLVDMDGDQRDDMVVVEDDALHILHQLDAPGWLVTDHPTPDLQFPFVFSLTAGDLDGNGFNDLMYGNSSGVSFLMADGEGVDYTEQAFPQYIYSQRGNMVDINNDGRLDAYMCHDFGQNAFYVNQGDGSFAVNQGQVGTEIGSYGSLWTDYDLDGDQDLFVSKCGVPIDEFYRNEGNLEFTDVAPALGFADLQESWSSAWGDFDNDGDQDVLVGNSVSGGSHKLMRNNGNGTFTNVTPGSGADGQIAQNVEWVTHDFDNDGNLDLLGGGYIHYGRGDMTFIPNITPTLNGAVGDINGDGFLDLVRGPQAQLNTGNDNHHLTVALTGVQSNRNGIGARVIVETASGLRVREVRSGDGFRFMSTLNAHFGLGQETEVLSVTIHWPSGIVNTITDAPIDGTVLFVEDVNTGIGAAAIGRTSVHPNPAATGHVTIQKDGRPWNGPVQLHNAAGALVLGTRAMDGSVDISSLTPGAYVLEFAGTKTLLIKE